MTQEPMDIHQLAQMKERELARLEEKEQQEAEEPEVQEEAEEPEVHEAGVAEQRAEDVQSEDTGEEYEEQLQEQQDLLELDEELENIFDASQLEDLPGPAPVIQLHEDLSSEVASWEVSPDISDVISDYCVRRSTATSTPSHQQRLEPIEEPTSPIDRQVESLPKTPQMGRTRAQTRTMRQNTPKVVKSPTDAIATERGRRGRG